MKIKAKTKLIKNTKYKIQFKLIEENKCMNTELNYQPVAKIKVFGVGGGGCNAINRIAEAAVEGIELYAVNTDRQVLNKSLASNTIAIGTNLTRGLGAGGNPEMGRKAAQESEKEISSAIEGADMVFVAAGMGGGTGTGAAPVIAKIAKDMGILTVGVITKPFTFEGTRRTKYALEGVGELRQNVDSLITISNDKLLELIGMKPMRESFREADNVLCLSVQTITDLIAIPAFINLDFADVTSVMKDRGNALIGIGMAEGDNKAKDAALKAINSPLLDISIAGAKDAIINVTGGPNVSLMDANIALQTICEEVGEEINTYFGVAVNDNLDDQIIVTVIATGLEKEDEAEPVSQFRKLEINTNNSDETEEEDFIPSFFSRRRV